MRRSLTKIPYPVIGRATTTTTSIAAAFSTGSGGGRGRGRATPTPFQFTVDSPSQTEPENSKYDDASPPPNGHGRGRGKPLPSFSSLLNNESKAPPQGRGRGFIPTDSSSPPPPPPQGESAQPSQRQPRPNVKLPFLFTKEEEAGDDSAESEALIRQEKTLPNDIMDVLGAGRGKAVKPPPAQFEKPKTENRHIRQRQQAKPRVDVASDVAAVDKRSPREELSQEEKAKKAVEILSRGGGEGGGGRAGAGARGGKGASGGRGRGRGDKKGRFSGTRRRGDKYDESDDESGGLYLGDPAEEEKMAKKLGPEIMNKLAEGFEEASSRALPSPMDDAYLDALQTNLSIECEPEYLMEEFGTNPDIDEKPPIPLRDALEKMKPFLMAYEGIKSQEEWEEIIEETMKTVPLMKEIVDYYSGPDRVTAKQQQEELDRVAKTLPASAPASVKRFTERAVLSLQSNPGWGFDKKCQFMDKLVMEVSKQYK